MNSDAILNDVPVEFSTFIKDFEMLFMSNFWHEWRKTLKGKDVLLLPDARTKSSRYHSIFLSKFYGANQVTICFHVISDIYFWKCHKCFKFPFPIYDI